MSDFENVSTTETPDLDNQIQEIFDKEDSEEVIENQEPADTEEVTENEQTETEKIEENQDNIKCPEKFLNSDGTVNVENLLKSYQQLEPLVNQKADWEKERAVLQQQAEYGKQLQAQQQALAVQRGFQNPDDMQLVMEVANAQANEYSKYLYMVEEPDKVRGLLSLYSQAPSPELLERIEDEFSVDVVKNVSLFAERLKNQVQERMNAERYEQYKKEAQEFVSNSIKEYPQWFEIPEFVDFFKDALEVKGDAFEMSKLVQHLENLKQYFHKQFIEEQKTNTENEKEKDSLKNLSPKTSANLVLNKKIEDYTDAELESAIEALV